MKNLINEADACRSNDKRNKPYKWSLDIAIFHHLYLKIPFFIRRVLRRPGRVLAKSEINRAGHGLSNTNRGATPMLTSSHGLLRVFPVLRRPGRARTPGDTTRQRLASLGCARSSPFASAKQRAFGSVHCPAASTPLAQLSRARGLRPEKPSADRGEAKAMRSRTSVGLMQILVSVWVAGASPRKAEGFFGLPLRTRSCARGV